MNIVVVFWIFKKQYIYCSLCICTANVSITWCLWSMLNLPVCIQYTQISISQTVHDQSNSFYVVTVNYTVAVYTNCMSFLACFGSVYITYALLDYLLTENKNKNYN